MQENWFFNLKNGIHRMNLPQSATKILVFYPSIRKTRFRGQEYISPYEEIPKTLFFDKKHPENLYLLWDPPFFILPIDLKLYLKSFEGPQVPLFSRYFFAIF